jgi:hypothetical protein
MYAFLVVGKHSTDLMTSDKKRISVSDLINLPKDSNIDISSITNIISLGKCSQEELTTLVSKESNRTTISKYGENGVKFRGALYIRVNTQNTCDGCSLRNHPDRESLGLCTKFNNLFNGKCESKQYKRSN